MGKVIEWNTDKPHRCPSCHAIANDTGERSSWVIYDCCQCPARFARWPRLRWFLRSAGVVCTEHRTPSVQCTPGA